MDIVKTVITMVLLSASTLANSAIIATYTDRTLFNNNVGQTSLDTFGNNAVFNIPNGTLNSLTNYDTISPGDIATGVTYSTPTNSGGSLNIDKSICLCNEFEGGLLDGGFLTDTDLTITYSPLISAFGFDTNGTMSNFQVTINFLSGDIYTNSFFIDPNDGTLSFFGFQSDAVDIQSVIISSDSRFSFAIDNNTFTSAVVPVPPAIWLFISGLAGLLFVRKKHA